MSRRSLMGFSLCLSAALSVVAADAPVPPRVKLSAAAIVDKNVQARGGLQAWRSVQTMALQGNLGAGGNQRTTIPVPGSNKSADKLALGARPVEEIYLPFVMQLKRPRKMRFELQFKGETAVQVFDGTNGWKYRPFLNRRTVDPYTADELRIASMQADLDGPLMDYAAKGTRVDLDGTEKVEGHDTYRLKLTMKNGTSTRVWIDAQTYLESKMEGEPRQLDGVLHPVEMYLRDYRAVSGLQIPFVLETRVLPAAAPGSGLKDPVVPPEETIFSKVVINPKLEESNFSKPKI